MDTQQQEKFKILLIGDACTDVYQYGIVQRISPEAPVPVFNTTTQESRPGMANNVANNLETFGCLVAVMSGNKSTKTRLIDQRSKQQIVRIDNDIPSDPLTFESIPYDIDNADAIVISDYDKGFVSYELIQKLRDYYSGPIFVDTKKTDLQKLDGCFIKINSLEYSKLISTPSKKENLIITKGEEGVLWNDISFSAKAVEVADVTGAGDTFLAALTYWYVNTQNMKQAIQFAIQASAVTVQHIGVYAPTLKEME